MHSTLKRIIQNKQHEVDVLKTQSIPNITELQTTKNFKQALLNTEFAIIGEVKRKSPSKGLLSHIPEPKELVAAYLEGDVAAISVLTDEKYFGGSLDDLKNIVEQLQATPIPVLRKEFIIDKCQIVESLQVGASAVLLIVAVLGEQTKPLFDYTKQLGLDAIIEVHDKAELEFAIGIGAEIIGINNRNLNTFEEDLNTCLSLIESIPENIITIAESAIRTPEDLAQIKKAGFQGALIGEALVTASNPTALLHQFKATA